MSTDTRNRNIIIVIVVLFALACCCLLAAVGIGAAVQAGRQAAQTIDRFEQGDFPASTTLSRSFEVDQPAELVVDLDIGALEIATGEDGVVQVDATVKAFGISDAEAQAMLDNLQLTATQSGSQVRVTGKWRDANPFRGRSPQVDVRVVVPQRTDIAVDLGAGSVDVTGVEGNADIKADVGKVTLRDLSIPDTMTVESGVAEVDFSGPLNDGSQYRFTSDVGAIQLRLPADSRFAIDAASDLGAVIVDFDVVGETTRELTGASVKGVVNGGSDTALYLRSDVGAIYVRQQ
ncbi:MAG: hypothetical protein R2844_20575 [Caldilineales bacterium]